MTKQRLLDSLDEKSSDCWEILPQYYVSFSWKLGVLIHITELTTFKGMGRYTQDSTHTHTHKRTHAHTQARTRTHVHAHAHTHTHTHIHARTHTHTKTHTDTPHTHIQNTDI